MKRMKRWYVEWKRPSGKEEYNGEIPAETAEEAIAKVMKDLTSYIGHDWKAEYQGEW